MDKHKRKKPLRYPYGTMMPGDYVFIETENTEKSKHRVTCAFDAYAKKHNMKFKSQKVGGGVQMTRIY